MKFSNKDDREEFEIKGFIEAYKRLPQATELEIVCKRERPDYLVRDALSGELFGVELTAVYLDDGSVPEEHSIANTGAIESHNDQNSVDLYIQRLLRAISAKIAKARNGYSVEHPLILAIYMNQHAGANIAREDLERMAREHRDVFDGMAPFSSIVVWNLANRGVCKLVPSDGCA